MPFTRRPSAPQKPRRPDVAGNGGRSPVRAAPAAAAAPCRPGTRARRTTTIYLRHAHMFTARASVA